MVNRNGAPKVRQCSSLYNGLSAQYLGTVAPSALDSDGALFVHALTDVAIKLTALRALDLDSYETDFLCKAAANAICSSVACGSVW